MFEFYFQRGEFSADSSGILDFIKNLVIQIAGTGIGAWAAFQVYRWQKQDLDIGKTKEKDQKDLDNVMYLDTLVQKSYECLLLYRESCKGFLQEVGNSMIEIPPLHITRSTAEIDTLVNKVDHKELFQSYQSVARAQKFKIDIKRSYPNGIARMSLALSRLQDDTQILVKISQKIEVSRNLITDNSRSIVFEIGAQSILFQERGITKSLTAAKTLLLGLTLEDKAAFQKGYKKFFDDVITAIGKVEPSEFDDRIQSILGKAAMAVSEFMTIEENIKDASDFISECIPVYTHHLEGIREDFHALRLYVNSLEG